MTRYFVDLAPDGTINGTVSADIPPGELDLPSGRMEVAADVWESAHQRLVEFHNGAFVQAAPPAQPPTPTQIQVLTSTVQKLTESVDMIVKNLGALSDKVTALESTPVQPVKP